MPEPTLIYDIETATDGRPNPEKDKLKVFGCYSYLSKKYYCLTSKDDIRKIISKHKYLVGFNNLQYDNVVLYNCGFHDLINKNDYGDARIKGKINIDLMQIFKTRAGVMKTDKGMLGDVLMRFSLDYITKTLGLVGEDDGKIKGFDYDVLKKEQWSAEETALIKAYTERDLEITKKLYEWVEDEFKSFKDFLNLKDIEDKQYLLCTTAVFAYKAICKELCIEEKYDSSANRTESFEGGFVALPTCEYAEGNILLFDFSSLYPNLFIMGNLFANNCSCCSFDEKWTGDGFFKIKGGTCKKNLHKLNMVLKNIYLRRIELKNEKNSKEYTYKIIINSLYGAISNPVFKNIYNLEAAENCTSLGRQFILYARKRFREEGYKNLMSDTDSIAVKVPENKTKEDAQLLADKITEELLKHMPFAW